MRYARDAEFCNLPATAATLFPTAASSCCSTLAILWAGDVGLEVGGKPMVVLGAAIEGTRLETSPMVEGRALFPKHVRDSREWRV